MGYISTPNEDSGEFPRWAFLAILLAVGGVMLGVAVWAIISQPARPSLRWATIVEDSGGGYMTLQLQDGSCAKASVDNNMGHTPVDCPPGILPHQRNISSDLGL